MYDVLTGWQQFMLGLGFDFVGEQLLLMLQSLADEKYLGHGCVLCVTAAVQSASLRAKSLTSSPVESWETTERRALSM